MGRTAMDDRIGKRALWLEKLRRARPVVSRKDAAGFWESITVAIVALQATGTSADAHVI